MRGTVVEVDERRQSAVFAHAGWKHQILADFAQVENCTPRRLDVGEYVEFDLLRTGNRLLAKQIRILVEG